VFFFRQDRELLHDAFDRLVYRIKYPFKLWLYGALDALVLALYPARPGKRILLFRCDQIGDYLLTRPFLPVLKADPGWSGWSWFLAGNAQVTDLVCHRDAVWIDGWIPIDRARFINSVVYRFRILRQIRLGGFGVVLNLSHTRQYWLESVLRVSGAPERYTGQPAGRYMSRAEQAISDSLYTRIWPTGGRVQFEFFRNRALFARLCAAASQIELPVLPRKPGGEKLRVRIAPGASAALRRWPARRFARLIADLYARFPVEVRIIGGPGETALADSILREAGRAEDGHFCGMYSLSETLEDLGQADLLISNESSPVHMAATLGVPCICLSQGNHFGRWNPWPAELAPQICTLYPPGFGDIRSNYAELTARFHDGSPVSMETLPYDTVWQETVRILEEIQAGRS
jgi:ADP-heptose:LPS heptosyltransferase